MYPIQPSQLHISNIYDEDWSLANYIEIFDNLEQKLIRTTQQHSQQIKLKSHHVI